MTTSLTHGIAHTVTVTNLRLRAAPSITATVLGGLPRGMTVELLAQNGLGWSQVQAGKKLGWVASKYVEPVGASASPLEPEEEFAWMPIALAERGVREDSGPGESNPRIVEYLRSTTLDRAQSSNDETPWCSAFVNWCVEHAGMAGTDSAAAQSWLDWGRPLVRPRRGCITVLSRNKKGGHVGFYAGRGDVTFAGALGVELLGGNQNDRVCVTGYDPARVLGYRVPR